MFEDFLVKPGTHCNLKKYDPDYSGKFNDKEEIQPRLDVLSEKMTDLQYKLYAEGKRALLIILQAMDAGGKDGAIKQVMGAWNPQGCQVASFKVPSIEELAHDFLWRIHMKIPPRGSIGIFNRSHYEDVLVVRIDNLVPEAKWKSRYDQINNFEKTVSENDVTILKFYLHISKDEQKKRFEKRIAQPDKNWKFSIEDLNKRKQWDDYMVAYEDALTKCSTTWAPWYVIPANRKWYRNLVIAEIITATLEKMDLKYPKPKEDLSKIVIE